MFNRDLAAVSNPATITTVQILRDTVEGTEGTEIYYKLLGSSENEDVKIATTLALREDTFYALVIDDGSAFGETVTCSGCRRGCDPDKEKSPTTGHIVWYCTECITTGDCTKSVSTRN